MESKLAKAVRRHFAAGDFLTRYPVGEPFELRIDSLSEKPGWKQRFASQFGKLPFPGTAIRFEDRYYEIILMAWEPADGKTRCCYYLSRWEDRFPIRIQYEYSQAECRKLVKARKEQAQTIRRTVLIKLLAPFLGLLPGDIQTQLENQYGVQATHITLYSALAMLFPGGFCLILFLASLFGPLAGEAPSRYQSFYLIGSYFFVEALLRLLSSMKLEEPMGSLLLFLPVETYRVIRRSLDPTYRQQRLERMQTGRMGDDLLLNARDEVSEVSSADHDLEVISLLPKPHWNPLTGVNYNGVWFGPIDTQTVRDGKTVRYRFLLKKVPEGTLFRTTCQYTPEEVRNLYRQQRRRDLGTWVDTFAVFWGLLDGKDQERLEELYNFDCLKFTRLTIFALAALALTNLAASIANLASGIGTAVDIILLLPCAYFLFESYIRWRLYRTGHPSGSLLGKLIRPLATRLLE